MPSHHPHRSCSPASARSAAAGRNAALAAGLVLLVGCGSSSGSGSTPGPAIISSSSGTATQTGSRATWILVGGATKPAYSDVYLDGELQSGELFVLPQSPLNPNATYQVSISAVAGAESFSHSWSFTTGGMSQSASDAVTALNNLRAESGEPSMTTYAALTTSSTKHAGYQAIENGGITHGETDTGNALYVANNFWDRISAADGGVFLEDEEYEDIASNGGVPSIALLWNTVYHRVPMMRASTNWVGFGDRNAAITAYPSANVPAASSGNPWGYATLDFAADTSIATLASYWPRDAASDVNATFDNSFPNRCIRSDLAIPTALRAARTPDPA